MKVLRFLILYPIMICLTGFQYGLEVQPLRHGLKFIVSYPQITFGVSDALMIELVHNQCEIYATHSSVVSPSFSETVCTKIAAKPHLLTDGCNNLPGLATFDRFFK